MDRHEQRRRLVAGGLHPIGERNEISSVRVMTTRYLPDFSMRSRNASPNQHQFLFTGAPGWVPCRGRHAPGSTTTGRESR
jgi:hypothetical protein